MVCNKIESTRASLKVNNSLFTRGCERISYLDSSHKKQESKKEIRTSIAQAKAVFSKKKFLF